MYICVYVYMYICIYVYINMYIYMFSYIYYVFICVSICLIYGGILSNNGHLMASLLPLHIPSLAGTPPAQGVYLPLDAPLSMLPIS